MDMVSAERRSEIMRGIRSKDTQPEMIVRQVVHSMGYRFRLHRADLPGKPDLVLPKWKTVILVNGCFWHGHTCKNGRRPKSNTDYWNEKLDRNKTRDAKNAAALRRLGWRKIVIWACETTDVEKLEQKLRRLLRDIEKKHETGQR